MKKRELTSNQLIEAAFVLFAQHGIEKTSLSMIAKEVGITKPSIYYHFASKEELVQRLFEYIFIDYRFEHYFQVEQFNEQNFAELLFEGGLKMFPEDNEEDYAVMRLLHEFMLTIGRNGNYAARVIQMQQQFLDGFCELMKKGAELGVIPPAQIETKAHMLALMIDNITNYMMMQIKLNYGDIWKETVNSVLLSAGK